MILGAERLLVALVVAPGTYTRNRHFALFQREDARAAQRRAHALRAAARDLVEADVTVTFAALDGGSRRRVVRYRREAVALRRELRLTDLELATLRVAVTAYVAATSDRALAEGLAATAQDRALVDGALALLAQRGLD